jgi:hypothetical protein
LRVEHGQDRVVVLVERARENVVRPRDGDPVDLEDVLQIPAVGGDEEVGAPDDRERAHGFIAGARRGREQVCQRLVAFEVDLEGRVDALLSMVQSGWWEGEAARESPCVEMAIVSVVDGALDPAHGVPVATAREWSLSVRRGCSLARTTGASSP